MSINFISVITRSSVVLLLTYLNFPGKENSSLLCDNETSKSVTMKDGNNENKYGS